MKAVQSIFDCSDSDNLMVESRKDALRINPVVRGLKVEFHGTKVTCDAGVSAYLKVFFAGAYYEKEFTLCIHGFSAVLCNLILGRFSLGLRDGRCHQKECHCESEHVYR